MTETNGPDHRRRDLHRMIKAWRAKASRKPAYTDNFRVHINQNPRKEQQMSTNAKLQDAGTGDVS